MLQFLQPAYWIAFAGLLVPIIIHLWNRRKGRRVKVGSIELLKVAEEQRLSSIKLSDLWRLFLRLLLLSCFICLMMSPYWRSSVKQQLGGKWALIDVAYLEHPALRTITDSLQKNEFEVRLLTQDFPLIEYAQNPVLERNYWSLLQDLLDLPVPPDSVFVLAKAELHHFQGQRPALNIPLNWKSLPVASPNYFIAKAWRNADELMILIGESDSEGTQFHHQKIPFENVEGEYQLASFPTLEIRQNKEHREVGFLNHRAGFVPVLDSFSFQVYLQSDPDFDLDKAYLAAALRAVNKYLDVSIGIQEQIERTTPPGTQDWLFWLSEKEIPDSLKSLFSPNLAIFQPGKAAPDSFFAQGLEEYHLIKRLESPEEQTRWLPHELIELLFRPIANEVYSEQELRTLAISQVLPRVEKNPAAIKKEDNKTLYSLLFPIWLILLLFFVLERK